MGYSDHSLAATIIHDTLWTSVPGTPLFKHKLGPIEKSYHETFFALSFFEGARVLRDQFFWALRHPLDGRSTQLYMYTVYAQQ